MWQKNPGFDPVLRCILFLIILFLLNLQQACAFSADMKSSDIPVDDMNKTMIASCVGEQKTEGDLLVRSNGIREIFGVSGKSVRVGVIANGAEHLNLSKKIGNLSDVRVLDTGIGDEGTAMLEIIHDIAPDAELSFHSYGNGSETFKHAVSELAKTGCQVICDDLYFFKQPFFEDGDVAQHIRETLKEYPNLIYITVSGNFATLHYQKPWNPGLSIGTDQTVHNFGNNDSAINMTLLPEEQLIATLQWDEPWGNTTTSYSLHLIDTWTGKLLAESNLTKNGSKDPFEHLVYKVGGKAPEKVALFIIRNGEIQGSNILELFMRGVDPRGIEDPFIKDPIDSIFGHAAVEDVITVGSVEPRAPYTISPDSSCGPVTIKHPTQTKRWKPDLSAPTNVNVSGTGNFPTTFPGTSAAAPHVAGVIAQLWSAFPDTSRDDLKQVIYDTCDDLGAPGWDEKYGYGLLNAERAYRVLYDRKSPIFNTNGMLFKK